VNASAKMFLRYEAEVDHQYHSSKEFSTVPTRWARHGGMALSGNALLLARMNDVVSPALQPTNQIAGLFAANVRTA
jgi:hypothetical protein